jgi:hypothetical protein
MTPLRRYYRGHSLVAMRDVQANQTRYYHFDNQGTIQALTDSTGAVTDRFASDAWGVQVKRTGSSINRQWYIGNLGYTRQVDQALDYARWRYYAGVHGRWGSVDPALAAGPPGRSLLRYLPARGDRWARTGAPDAGSSRRRRRSPVWSAYAYGDNDPAVRVDPSGLQPPACPPVNLCGPNVAPNAIAALERMDQLFASWSVGKRTRHCLNLVNPLGVATSAWDLRELRYPPPKTPHCPSQPCSGTVEIRMGCHDVWAVNYVTYGRMFRLCQYCGDLMWLAIWYYQERVLHDHDPAHFEAKIKWAFAGLDGWPIAGVPTPPGNRPDCPTGCAERDPRKYHVYWLPTGTLE